MEIELYRKAGEDVYKNILHFRHDPLLREQFLQSLFQRGYTILEIGAIVDWAIDLFLDDLPKEWTAGRVSKESEGRVFSFMVYDLRHMPESLIESAKRWAVLLHNTPHSKRGQFLREFFDCIVMFYEPERNLFCRDIKPENQGSEFFVHKPGEA